MESVPEPNGKSDGPEFKVSVDSSRQSSSKDNSTSTKLTRNPRRADVDLLRVAATYAIFVYHVSKIYLPFVYFVKDPFRSYLTKDWSNELGVFFRDWILSFILPLFFFLSGANAFSSLGRRTERQFRLERFHRLMVPVLFLMAFTNLGYLSIYWAPIKDACHWQRFHLTPSQESCLLIPYLNPGFPANQTVVDFLSHLFNVYPYTPSASQGWFLVYLFLYSQLFATFFSVRHPSSASSSSSSSFRRRLRFVLGCGAPTPESFAGAVDSWIGGASGVKLALVPGAVLAVIEIVCRWIPPPTFSFLAAFQDLHDGVSYSFVFVAGYAVATVDDRLELTLKRKAWLFFVVGHVVLLGYSNWLSRSARIIDLGKSGGLFLHRLVGGVLRGFGEWTALLGTCGVARRLLPNYPALLAALAEMTMPFYVTHEQILVLLASLLLHHHILGLFPFVVVIVTIVVVVVSFLIVKSGRFRYFFGLRTDKWGLPGDVCWGLAPGVFLGGVLVIEMGAAHAWRVWSG